MADTRNGSGGGKTAQRNRANNGVRSGRTIRSASGLERLSAILLEYRISVRFEYDQRTLGKSILQAPTCIPATPDDLLRLGSYTAKEDEWPEHGMEIEVERLLKGIDRIMEFALAEPFAAPVDLNAYPQYCLSIEYPSDLSTIKARLENRFYRRKRAFRFDVVQIAKNAAQFNERRSTIVKRARLLVEILLKYLEDPQCEDIVTIHNEVMSASSLLTSVATPPAAANEEGSADDSSNGRRLRRRKYIKEYREPDENGNREERSRRMTRIRNRDTSDDEECESSEVVVSTSMRGRLRKLRKFT